MLFFYQNMPNVAEAFRTTDADIQKAQDASGQYFLLSVFPAPNAYLLVLLSWSVPGKAPVERGSSSTPALEMNPMRRNENNA